MRFQPILLLAACFGLGIGLAPTIRSAHACSCVDTADWSLERVEVVGTGDVDAERPFWPVDASFTDQNGPNLWIGHEIELERVSP